ncbi:MAG: hypothetical protein QHH14_08135 [Clostridiales bacterium]|nr:hypothetical protein [Clostridiales bacterium]
MAREVKVLLTPEQQTRFSSPRKVNPAVYEAYLRGIYHITQYTEENIDRGLKYLHEAVEIDLAEPLAYAGRRQEALDIAEHMDASRAWFTAQIYAALGEKSKALDLLEACYRDRVPVLPWIRVHGGEYDALRDEPRFQELLKRMNLPL